MGKGSNATERVTNRRSGPTQPRFFETSNPIPMDIIEVIMELATSSASTTKKSNGGKQKSKTHERLR